LVSLDYINFAINPAAHVKPIELKAALIFRFNYNDSNLDLEDLGLIEEDIYTRRTPYMSLPDLEDYNFKFIHSKSNFPFAQSPTNPFPPLMTLEPDLSFHPEAGLEIELHVVAVFEPEPSVVKIDRTCFEFSKVTDNILFGSKYKVEDIQPKPSCNSVVPVSYNPYIWSIYTQSAAAHPLIIKKRLWLSRLIIKT
jgi:hypothetical protein